MNRKTIFRNILLAVFVLCMGLILCPNDTAAFSLKSSEIDRIVHAEPDFKMNTLFMEVNQKEGYVFAGEITIYLMDFKAGDKHYQTVFKNERADIICCICEEFPMERKKSSHKRLWSGDIVAESIEKIADRHK